MSGHKQDKNPVAGVCPKRVQEKRQISTPSSSKKLKCTRTSPTSDEITIVDLASDDRENCLASTQRFRELLSNNEARNGPIAKSEEIFRENLNLLLNGIDECAGKTVKWSRHDTNLFYNKIISFVLRWKKQLLKENTEEKVSLTKRDLEDKRDLVTSQLNLLTSVYHESAAFMKFSASQTKVFDSKFKELNKVRKRKQSFSSQPCSTTLSKNENLELNQADKYREELRKAQDSLEEAHSKFNESSFAAEMLKNKNRELNEARKQANEYLGELKKTQNSLKEAHLKLNDLMTTNNPPTQVDPRVMLRDLQDKKNQINNLETLLDWGAIKQKKTECELMETREQLQSFVAKSREMTQTKQKDMNKKLSEIQTLLLMINPSYRPSCQIENESLSKEEQIFEDIKAIIEYNRNAAKSGNNCEPNPTESALETNSSSASLRVSEYEMHLVTLIAAFLKLTPFRVSSQTIYSYVANIDTVVDLQFVESLLRKFPSFFKEVAGAPGSMAKNWIYLDLKPVITI